MKYYARVTRKMTGEVVDEKYHLGGLASHASAGFVKIYVETLNEISETSHYELLNPEDKIQRTFRFTSDHGEPRKPILMVKWDYKHNE